MNLFKILAKSLTLFGTIASFAIPITIILSPKWLKVIKTKFGNLICREVEGLSLSGKGVRIMCMFERDSIESRVLKAIRFVEVVGRKTTGVKYPFIPVGLVRRR